MKRQSFYIITRKGKYSNDDELLWFNDLDKALEIFRMIVGGSTVNIDSEEVQKKGSTSSYDKDHLHYIKDEGDYRIECRHVNIYSQKEIAEIKKERRKEDE